MELEVAPDGLVFLIELEGQVSVFDPNTAERRTVLQLDVFHQQENGLLGLALDPDFETTRHVFLLYSPPDLIGQRLARFDWDGEVLVEQSEVVLFEFEEQRRECCHHAGALEFGPDGCLFISTGDNTHPHADSHGYAPIDERDDRFPWDAQRSSANTEVYGGKILRVRPLPDGTIEIPEGNLFPGGEGGRPEIYVMGCRNPWRFGVDQQTGHVYWGDVGPDARGDGPRGPRGYDEVNQARAAGNFGWPLFIADNKPYAWVDYHTGTVGTLFDPERPVNRSPNNTGAKVLPPAQPALIWYPYGHSDEFPMLDDPGGRSACAGPVYDFDPALESATKLPQWFDRGLFIFEWSRHWISVVHLDDDSGIASITRLPGGFSFKRPVDIDIAPDGTLYVLEYGETWNANADSAVVRIDYHPGNRPPRAVAQVTPMIGAAPLLVHLSAAGTVDLDGDDLTYRWLSKEGVVLAEGREADVTIAEEGEHTLALEVTDAGGAVGRSSIGLVVGNTPPVVTLLEPRDGGFFAPGEEVRWRLDVRDAEDGTPAQGDPQWWTEGTSVQAHFVQGPPPRAGALEQHPAVERMRASDCFNCHAVDHRVVGPAFLEIADRYRGEGGAFERSVGRVRDGSSGVWGAEPMLPHEHLRPEELREMVAWVFAQEGDSSGHFTQGFSGELALEGGESSGCWVLEASFTDGGGGLEAVPNLTSSARVVVRSRRVEAEHFTDRHGTGPIDSETASNARFIGHIHDGHHLRFEGLDLAGIRRVRVRVASGGVGGFLELRHAERDGPVLASTWVESNGEWEDWHEQELQIEPPSGKADVYVCFRAGEKQGGLMNLDWLEFLEGE